MDEQKAIASLKKGNLDAFEFLVDRYQRKAYHSANLILRDSALAEDVVHQAFLNAYDHIHRFDESRPFAPWFFRIVINLAINLSKRQRKLSPLHEEPEEDENALARWIIDPQPMPEDCLSHIQTARELRDALSKLNPEHRAVLVMRYYLQMDNKEIAQKARKPLSTIKWWLHSAKRQVRAQLEKQDSPCTNK